MPQPRGQNRKTGAFIAISVVVLILAAVFFLRPSPEGVVVPEEEEQWSYLPNRAYIIAATEPESPQTLAELLHSRAPSVDTFLRHPAIAQELLKATSWTDIVDSRTALYNLRELDRQLEEMLLTEFEYPEFAAYIPPEEGLLAQTLRELLAPETPDQPPVLTPVNYSVSLTTTPLENLKAQYNLLEELKATVGKLLVPPTGDGDELIPQDILINLKGVWQSPGEALLHMTPEGDGLLYDGYTLARSIGGQETVIARGVAAEEAGINGNIMRNVTRELTGADGEKVSRDFGAYIQELYRRAQLTPAKLALMEIENSADFRRIVYSAGAYEPTKILDSADAFHALGTACITVPANFMDKMPESDKLHATPIVVMGQQASRLLAVDYVNSALSAASIYVPSKQMMGIERFGQPGDIRYNAAAEILAARQQISTMSYVDHEFAEAAGFFISDDLSALGLPDGEVVTYIARAGEVETTVTVVIGEETNLTIPQGLAGYGYDGVVSLRWDDLSLDTGANPVEQGIISGYHIERRLNGESEFRQITNEPVVISYVQDERTWLQTTIFFQDEVANGRTAEYRVCSIDIFGRSSDFSSPLTVQVEKVTAPEAPSVGTPVLSREVDTNQVYLPLSADYALNVSVQNSVKLNPGVDGVVIPIFTASPDTDRFTVYRAVAVGAGTFSDPLPYINLTYENPKRGLSEQDILNAPEISSLAATTSVLLKGANQVVLRQNQGNWPDLVFFDANVTEGCTYKYWVAAWDEERWSNESAWSQAVIAAVPTAREPQRPDALDIAMLVRALPDYSDNAPGLVNDATISYQDMQYAAVSNTALRFPAPDPSSDAATHTNINEVKMVVADNTKVSIGSFSKFGIQPLLIGSQFANLPENKYFHTFLAVPGSTVLADGTARLQWPAYSGEGLEGYNVYQAMFEPLSLEVMQKMTRSELLQLGDWQRMNTDPLIQNKFTLSGLSRDAEMLYLFLVCLQPNAQAVASTAAPTDQPATMGWPTLSSLQLDLPGTLQVTDSGEVHIMPQGWSPLIYNTGYTWSADDDLFYWKCLSKALGIVKSYDALDGSPWSVIINGYYKAYTAALAEMAVFGLATPEKPEMPMPPLLSSIPAHALGTLHLSFTGKFTANLSGGGWWTFDTGITRTKEDNEFVLNCFQAFFATETTFAMTSPMPVIISYYYNAYTAAYAGFQHRTLAAYRHELAQYEEFMELISRVIVAGYVEIAWEAPADPQVKFYRVYRAEVLSFQTQANESLLEWTLVGDFLATPQFTDPVDQSHARYYYYKVTSVSPWGVENSVGRVQRFRVPSTIPPATPNLLVPLQRKDGVQVNFSAVQYCDKYVLYRAEIPKISDTYIAQLSTGIKNTLFGIPTINDSFMKNMLQDAISLQVSTSPSRQLNAV
ncbi:MAG: hypothetical protein FWF06_06670, partial [Symbiobacteriaceae bacterium]|nr:hypothetical protein [Symbiobacteriaceae bacterium]